MVRELQVHAPEVSKWKDPDASREVLFDFVFQGVALPDDFRQELLKESGLEGLYSEAATSKAQASAAAEWDAYHLWQASRPEVEELTPGARLALYFSGGKHEDQ